METKDYITVLLSASALILSLVTLLLKKPENRRTIRNQLTDIIGKLNAVQAEASKLSMEKAGERYDPQVNAWFAFFNDQRRYLVRQAVFLIQQIPKNVSDAEYNVVARAFDAIGDQSQADYYWSRCIDSSPNQYNRSLNLRGYARYLFSQGAFEDGRKRFEESLALLTSDGDRMLHTRGETYLRWANAEADSGFSHEAEVLFGRARATFESLGNKGLKHHGLSILENAEKAFASSAPSPAGDLGQRPTLGLNRTDTALPHGPAG